MRRLNGEELTSALIDADYPLETYLQKNPAACMAEIYAPIGPKFNPGVKNQL